VSNPGKPLNTTNHDRNATGMTYVYPVVSRRAGGVSVGINLNPNNACNWRCAYCQVPNLTRGSAPDIDRELLRRELTSLLGDLLQGDFMQQRVPEASRRLCDVALSGNGEPTSCRDFADVIATVIAVMRQFRLCVPLRLITNGSYLHRPHVQLGIKRMAEANGELWVKIDAATKPAIQRINGIGCDADFFRQRLRIAASHCPTWIQSCMVTWDGEPPSAPEVDAYLDLLRSLKQEGIAIRGVLLYALARPSLQPEAPRLGTPTQAWMQQLATAINQIGFDVKQST